MADLDATATLLALKGPRSSREVAGGTASTAMLLATRLVHRWAVVALLVVTWEVGPRWGWVDAALLPPLSEVLRTGYTLVRNGQLAMHVGASISRSLTGLAAAILVGVPLGLAIGWYRKIEIALSPFLEVARNTAALALLPVFILLLGIGESSKVALVAYSCVWPVLLNTVSAVRSVDPMLVKSARTMGLSSLQLFRKVILPASIPSIFVGVRLAGAYSLLVLVAAEMIGAKAGLGYLIIYSQYNFQLPQMYVGIITTTVLGLVFNHSLLRVERHLNAWKVAPE